MFIKKEKKEKEKKTWPQTTEEILLKNLQF